MYMEYQYGENVKNCIYNLASLVCLASSVREA